MAVFLRMFCSKIFDGVYSDPVVEISIQKCDQPVIYLTFWYATMHSRISFGEL